MNSVTPVADGDCQTNRRISAVPYIRRDRPLGPSLVRSPLYTKEPGGIIFAEAYPKQHTGKNNVIVRECQLSPVSAYQ